MTAVLERVEPATPPLPPQHPSRLARWWSSWRVALRLARRDAWHGKGRALLVLLLIALPVAAVVGSISYSLAQTRADSPVNRSLRSLGPTADARIVVAPAAVDQSVDATTVGSGSGPVPSREQILRALPPGSTLVDGGGVAPVVLEVGPWGVTDTVTVADVREPLNASRWIVESGRLPTAATEIAMAPEEIARLQAHVGDAVTVTTTSGAEHVVRLTLVGSVRAYSQAQTFTNGVVLPGSVPIDPSFQTLPPVDASEPSHQSVPTEFLATTSRPLTWADVRALNAIGAAVVSRSVLESPPSFCPSTAVVCLDSGPEPQPEAASEFVSDTELQNAARAAALSVVILVLVVLQVALLAGPAFAVQLRRRQRELGLVGASGGTSADLRRAVLASGLVLGVAGGALGIALGWTTVLLLGGVLPWAPLASYDAALGIPPLPWYVLGVALIGVIAAVVASLVPAVLAGRGDVVDALRGRRPLPALRTRTPIVGLLLGLAGVGVMAYGRFKVDGLITGVGIIVGELGLVLVMPWLVVRAGQLGRWLPLSSRMAVRDSGRHRLRTAAAACAIAAAAAAAVATSTWAASYAYVTSSTDVPFPPGTVAVQAFTSGSGAAADDPATLTRRTTAVVESVAPGSRTAVLLAVAPHDAPQVTTGLGNTGSVGCLVPAGSTPSAQGQTAVAVSPSTLVADGSEWQNCSGRVAVNGGLGGEVVLLQDPSTLGLLLGPIADVGAATAELEKGGAVVLQPHSLDANGEVVLQSAVVLPDGSQTMGTPFRVPAVEVLTGALPASVILGPKALEPGGAAAGLRPDPATQTIVVAPSVADRPDRPTVAEQITLGLMKARVAGGTLDGTLNESDGTAVQLAVIGAGALLLALLAGLMVTALALADGRSDITTLAAVGAEPRVRRRIAASSAGFVAALGCATGVVSGLVLAWLLNPLFNRFGSPTTVIHWWLVAFVLLGIPAITAAVAWLTTRSTIVLTRRRD